MATQGLRRAVSLPDRDGRSSAKGEIDAVLWARDAAVDVIAPRSRLPLWGGEGGAGVLRLDDEGAAGVGPAWAQEEVALAAEAGDHVGPGVVLAMGH